MSIPFEVLEKLSIPVTEHKSGPKEHFEMLKVIVRVLGGGGEGEGGHLGLIVMHLTSSAIDELGHWCLQSW